MKSSALVLLLLLSLLLGACTDSTCPPDAVSYLEPPYPPEDLDSVPQAQVLQLGRQQVQVDQIISGVVCNDSWSGTIYVTCQIQIPAWEEEALFFQDCDLEIEEGTVIYTQPHGDQPYLQGCSCHE